MLRPYVTRELHDYLKKAVDEAQRARTVSHANPLHREGFCAGCGTSWDNYTDGCLLCYNRRAGREKRRSRMKGLNGGKAA